MKMHAKRTIAAVFGTFDTLKSAVSASREFNHQAELRRARHGYTDFDRTI